MALVAAENPAVKWGFFTLAKAFDCGARYAMRSIYMSLFYSTIRTRVDASATLATAHCFERFVVVVALLVHNDFAK